LDFCTLDFGKQALVGSYRHHNCPLAVFVRAQQQRAQSWSTEEEKREKPTS